MLLIVVAISCVELRASSIVDCSLLSLTPLQLMLLIVVTVSCIELRASIIVDFSFYSSQLILLEIDLSRMITNNSVGCQLFYSLDLNRDKQ